MALSRLARQRRAMHRRLSAGLGLGVGLVLGFQLVAVPAVAAVPAKLEYAVFAFGVPRTMCVGDVAKIHASIARVVTVNGKHYANYVSGGEVAATVRNDPVGRFEPDDPVRPVLAPDEWATYDFVATQAGHTDIVFTIFHTGEDGRVGPFHRFNDAIASIDVTDCYDAYTSGLATVFDTKNMGDLTKPFLLAGHIATSRVAGSSQFMYFIPTSPTGDHGAYALVDTAWPVGGRGSCVAYVSGTYAVVLYGDPAKPVEGDLLMKGSGQAICTGATVPLDYADLTGFQIAFKPRRSVP
jgi:hypothetical protein